MAGGGGFGGEGGGSSYVRAGRGLITSGSHEAVIWVAVKVGRGVG